MPLKAKVVITFGMRHTMAEYIVEWTEHLASKKDLCAEDLRQSLKDPLKDNQVQHEMDASNAQTFVAVMAQPTRITLREQCSGDAATLRNRTRYYRRGSPAF